ncbi:MAG TPA: trehalase family glycosidase [Candidatus Baltobacteraceae bacterium]|nr:trehalase family glycosidase [Candidatus Baltobacteraceae bacterium]
MRRVRMRDYFFSLLGAGLLAMANPASNAAGVRPDDASNQRAMRQSTGPSQSFQSLSDILEYVSDDWTNLRRSLAECKTYEDVKTSSEHALYLPADAEAPAGLAEALQRCDVRILHLSAKISEEQAGQILPHGLLYLPNPYVVPGGQFNEMYGWDSYFIIRGLLRDNQRDAAKGIVENFFYEIQHYGGVLNANRTYYLGRSQPPFLSSMILAVYEADKAAGRADPAWLEKAYAFAVEDHDQWTRAPHLAGDTGLSRYFDEGNGPVPEIMGDPSDYYRGVTHYFLIHEGEDGAHLARVDAEHPADSLLGPKYEVRVCDPGASQIGDKDCEAADRVALSADYYKGDRSMRESGFDVTFRFGPYGAETHHFAPVCLNSLLYKTERDLEQMSLLLGRKDDARKWAQQAAERRERMVKYFWDEQKGLFFDYDFMKRERSSYDYATTFYPLWAGLASKEEARAVDANLKLFEQPGGLAMSRFDSQAQWDYPYGWAPIHLLAIEGLRRYGYAADANRITEKFLSMVLQNFRTDHTIREKYDVVTRSSATHIEAGYAQNVTGFGWTNGVFLVLLHEAPPEVTEQLKRAP